MTREETLNKIMEIANQLEQKYDHDMDNYMQDICCMWNLEHLDDESEQIDITWEEDDTDKFYVDWVPFRYNR